MVFTAILDQTQGATVNRESQDFSLCTWTKDRDSATQRSNCCGCLLHRLQADNGTTQSDLITVMYDWTFPLLLFSHAFKQGFSPCFLLIVGTCAFFFLKSQGLCTHFPPSSDTSVWLVDVIQLVASWQMPQ